MKVQLIEKLSEHVPDSINFNVGYFEGKQSKKRWICCQEDITTMYKFFNPGSEILLWCDGKKTSVEEDEHRSSSRKRKQEVMTKREEKEEEVEDTYAELKERHGDKYDIPKLRLWARMVTSGLHDSTDEPPAVPIFSNVTPKRRRSVISDAITDAAGAIMKSINSSSTNTPTPTSSSSVVNQSGLNEVSSGLGQATELRMKNMEQLRYLQGLYNDNIITEDELVEQKQMILETIRKLSN